jgi:hypothetical protein
MGGEEDIWAFDTGTGQRVGLLLRVPYKLVVVFSDVPNTELALAALADAIDKESLRIFSAPAKF